MLVLRDGMDAWGPRDIGEIFVPSFQFCYKPKTALKFVIKEINVDQCKQGHSKHEIENRNYKGKGQKIFYINLKKFNN